ncbi:hypothetical protein C8Q75DRAFT_738376, partial [Abortiporus biennis]
MQASDETITASGGYVLVAHASALIAVVAQFPLPPGPLFVDLIAIPGLSFAFIGRRGEGLLRAGVVDLSI